LPKFVDACDIEKKIGLDQAHVEHGAQRLTTGYHLDRMAALSEQQ
jgi:hypothetical protein